MVAHTSICCKAAEGTVFPCSLRISQKVPRIFFVSKAVRFPMAHNCLGERTRTVDSPLACPSSVASLRCHKCRPQAGSKPHERLSGWQMGTSVPVREGYPITSTLLAFLWHWFLHKCFAGPPFCSCPFQGLAHYCCCY